MFEHLSHFWESAEPYLYQLLIGSIAILALLKDWRDYGEASGEHRTLVRVSVLLVTAAVILLSLVETHNSRRDAWLNEQAAAQRDIRNQSTIKDLTDQVRQEREENRSNSEGFRKSFAALLR